MPAEPAPRTDLSPAPHVIPEAEAFGIHVVICDAAGRPRTHRLLRLSECLGTLPPSGGRAA